MGNKTLIRPDGSELLVSDAEASKLLTLGYREKSHSQILEDAINVGTEEHYTTPGQKLLTGLEGGLSGLTLGASDLLINGEDTQERAKYNPGTRLATELIGGLAPVAPGLSILKNTPAGLLSRGALKAGEKLGRGSATIKSTIAGAVEGAGVGAGQAVTQAELSGDPVTAESVMAGMGWGAIYGGGLAGIGGYAADKFEKRAARAAAEGEAALAASKTKAEGPLKQAKLEGDVHDYVAEKIRSRNAAKGAVEADGYDSLWRGIQDARQEIKLAADEIKKIDLPAMSKGMAAEVKDRVGQVDDVVPRPKVELRPMKSELTKMESSLIDSKNIKQVRKPMRGAQESLNKAMAAAKDGDFKALTTNLEKFKEHMLLVETTVGDKTAAKLAKDSGYVAGVIKGYGEKVKAAAGSIEETVGAQAQLRMKTATAAVEQATRSEAIHTVLAGFPKTVDEFVGMTKEKVEKLTAAIDSVSKLQPAEFAGVKEALKVNVDNFAQKLGVELEGTPGMKVQGLWKLMREANTKRVADETFLAKNGKRVWDNVSKAQNKTPSAAKTAEGAKTAARAPWGARYMVGSWAANRAGGGTTGAAAYVAGSWLVSTLMGMKGAVLGTISEKANKWIPRMGRGAKLVGPRVEPFLVRLDGQQETERKTRAELMQARAKEIAEAAPGVRDTLYRSLQPLAISNPKLAAQLHAHGVSRFQFLLSKMPKDPGLAFSNLKSLWKPDAIAMEKFARYYEVFQNPVGVVSRALDTGHISIEAAEGLREMNPELFGYLRAEMLNRIADPEVREKMKYADQVHMGILLDLPVHSTMDPRFIAPQQQMFTERNQPLEMNPRIQPGGGAGRPSGPGPSATSAQRSTEH